jgi:uncharacterized protein
MSAVTLLYNLVMLAVDVVAIWLVGRYRGLLVWCAVMACAALAATVVGGLLAGYFQHHFAVVRLWAYGLFLHLVILLAATAILWRRRRPILAGIAILAITATLLIALDAFLIEPHWLKITHYQIASPKIHRPVRIVVVADLQTNSFGAYERGVLRQTLAQKPDIILLAGDYIQAPWQEQLHIQRQLNDDLAKIRFSAPQGLFAVQGNVDSPAWKDSFRGLGITMIDANRSFALDDLELTCLGLSTSYQTNARIDNPRPDDFHLVMGHVPNFALGTIDADLLVAGHTHGGQSQLPWVGPLVTHSRIPRQWCAGLTELSGGRKLLVSCGVGMERGYAPPMRFLCRPELVVIDLAPKEQ